MTATPAVADASPGPGAAHLVNIQRRMTLFAEAISGRSVLIAPVEQAEAGFRSNVFSTDGKHYWLPASIGLYPDFEANYAFYRVALLHQIGYQLHGTFEFTIEEHQRRYPEIALPSLTRQSSATARHRHGPSDLERFFASAEQARLLQWLFATIEAWRIDLQNFRQFPGLRKHLARTMVFALSQRHRHTQPGSAEAIAESLVELTLCPPGEPPTLTTARPAPDWLTDSLQPVTTNTASVYDSAAAALSIHATLRAEGQLAAMMDLLADTNLPLESAQKPSPADATVAASPVQYRGDVFAMPALSSRRAQQLSATLSATPGSSSANRDETPSADQAGCTPSADTTEPAAAKPKARFVLIDEWDYLNQQTLRGWCCLHEYRLEGGKSGFRGDLLNRYRDDYHQIRRQFNTLRPEAIRIQRGLTDGEDFELDRLITQIADRRAGQVTDDRLYQRRNRAERDVAAAFLLDMSASTDFQVPEPGSAAEIAPDDNVPANTPVQVELDDIGWSPYDAYDVTPTTSSTPARRVIDIAREALGLISAVLQDLGDRFALYGFSGRGRHQVDFGVIKEFNQACSSQTWSALAAVEPQGSSRMGAPIRHVSKRLAKVSAKTKVLIIVSDGYPQDIDYGPDRTSDEYGLQDTAHAIKEAGKHGILVFCLSVDPGGHDYLRRLCPQNRYLVIDEINALPTELIKVYQGLTRST